MYMSKHSLVKELHEKYKKKCEKVPDLSCKKFL